MVEWFEESGCFEGGIELPHAWAVEQMNPVAWVRPSWLGQRGAAFKQLMWAEWVMGVWVWVPPHALSWPTATGEIGNVSVGCGRLSMQSGLQDLPAHHSITCIASPHPHTNPIFTCFPFQTEPLSKVSKFQRHPTNPQNRPPISELLVRGSLL